MRSSLCSTVWYTVCLIQVLCHEPFLCVVTSAPLDTGASRVDSAGRGRWLEPPASSRNRRQTTGGPLDDVLSGQTPANCTEEDEFQYICPFLARCYSLPGALICVCGEGIAGSICPGDFDECRSGTDVCEGRGECRNSFGSFTCSCNRGYIRGESDTSCIDDNECLDNQLPCHLQADCFNTIGSFQCRCKDGYVGDGFDCEDIDECSEGVHGCHANAICTNTAGSVTCKCSVGYTGNGQECFEIIDNSQGIATTRTPDVVPTVDTTAIEPPANTRGSSGVTSPRGTLLPRPRPADTGQNLRFRMSSLSQDGSGHASSDSDDSASKEDDSDATSAISLFAGSDMSSSLD